MASRPQGDNAYSFCPVRIRSRVCSSRSSSCTSVYHRAASLTQTWAVLQDKQRRICSGKTRPESNQTRSKPVKTVVNRSVLRTVAASDSWLVWIFVKSCEKLRADLLSPGLVWCRLLWLFWVCEKCWSAKRTHTTEAINADAEGVHPLSQQKSFTRVHLCVGENPWRQVPCVYEKISHTPTHEFSNAE